MMRCSPVGVLVAVPLAALLLMCPAAGQEPEAAHDPMALFEAYQVGFLQVVAVACYQSYSSIGIIATDYADGYIDEATARFALDENALLLSVCSANVLEVGGQTPAQDEVATAELDRLAELLGALNALVSALDVLLDNPTDEQAQVVEEARATVERLLDSYASSAG